MTGRNKSLDGVWWKLASASRSRNTKAPRCTSFCMFVEQEESKGERGSWEVREVTADLSLS